MSCLVEFVYWWSNNQKEIEFFISNYNLNEIEEKNLFNLAE